MWREFVELAEKRAEPFAGLCARFGVSRKTGYKWLKRFRAEGPAGLAPQSRRPKRSPRRTPDEVVDAILALRRENPDWSSARIQSELARQGRSAPASSTIDLILRRQREAAAAQLQALGPEVMRFEPNYRWIIRESPEVRLAGGVLATAVVVQDETTDFIVGATLLTTRRETALESFLGELFQRHGHPWRVRIPRDPALRGEAPARAHSPVSVWLVGLGILVEFEHETVAAGGGPSDNQDARAQLAVRLASLPAYQRAALAERVPHPDPLRLFVAAAARLTPESAPAELERLREEHNFSGYHDVAQRRSPISLYRPSPRRLPPVAAKVSYPPDAVVRLVSEKGMFTFKHRLVHVGRAFAGMLVELKPTPYAERYVVLFAGQMLGVADLAQAESGASTSLQLRAP